MNTSKYKKAEALGELKTMPEIQLDDVKTQVEDSVIDNPDDFRAAIGNAQLDGLDYLEVSEKLFKYLLKNSKSPYLTYGDPGIKVFLKGTREEIEREERMNAEEYSNHMANKKRTALGLR